jgi:chromosome segregation protein
MLKIEKLLITGFKSFAEPTEVVLGEGITAVVGPNGCGKSNISDAISWVLGEQSARSLRGSKMEDVIFNGTRDRKPQGMAEVVLTLRAVEDIVAGREGDEVEIEGAGSVPEEARQSTRRRAGDTVLSAGERVTVGRRLYRSGESEYLMNGRACRLRDVQDLFAGTGLGGVHYAIIEQGRIGQILSSKPQDRRGLIEEAAGITKFKSRKRAAELRLESARANLLRLNDIVSEVERQVGSLKRQAAKARRYRRLKEEMRELMREILACDWEALQSSLEAVGLEVEATQQQHDLLLAELRAREQGHRDAVVATRAAEHALAVLRDRAAAVELEADRAANRHVYQGEQLAGLMLRREELERERDRVAERLELVCAELARRQQDQAALVRETDGEAVLLAEMEAAYQALVQAREQCERALEALRSQFVAGVTRIERLRTTEGQMDDAARRLEADRTRLEREAERASDRRAEAEAHLAELGEDVAIGRARLEELRAVIVDRVERLASARQRADALAGRLKELHDLRSARAHRLASLEELDARHAYYTDAVKQVLGLDENHVRTLGTLADHADPDGRYEVALESLFGRELQAILVPGLDDALSGIEYLVATDAGRASFLVVGVAGAEDSGSVASDDIEDVAPAGGGGVRSTDFPERALRLLGLPPHIETAVARAYPEKAAALVVPDMTDALERSRLAEANGDAQTFVTLEGEQVQNGRVVMGGARNATGANLLGVKREIKSLKAELERIVWEVGALEAELAEARHDVAEIEAESEQLDSTLRDDERLDFERSIRFQQAEADFQRAEQLIRVNESERRRLGEEAEALAARRAAVVDEIRPASEAHEAVAAEVQKGQAELAACRERLEVEGKVLSEARAAAAARQERRRAVAAEVRRLGDEQSELQARLDRNRLEYLEAEARIAEVSAALSETASRKDQFSDERAGMDEALTAAMQRLTYARSESDAIEAAISELRERLEGVRARRSELEIERARLLADEEHIRRDAYAELGQTVEEVVEAASAVRARGNDGLAQTVEEGEEEEGQGVAADDPLASSRERLDTVRLRLEQLGGVNMMAPEELAEAESRFEFLTAQRQDVLQSIDSTERALGEIKRRSRQRFREAFAQINENFGAMFQELFGGGRGEMILLDEDDLLESGIDIIAQPPGKRLQNVLLLSGGEKAMTAIALVLAIFRYKPSPFCILDEVDAPLDEVNVGRFSDHVIEMSQSTQFLVITHSKRTMEAARALYGVTMEEPGVSKLVSVRFANE